MFHIFIHGFTDCVDELGGSKSKDGVSSLKNIGSEELYMQIMKEEQFGKN